MPGGDKTGPLGQCPMTGRGLGRCAGFEVSGYMNPSGGRGVRRMRGWRCFGGFGGWGGRFRSRWFSRMRFFRGGSTEETEALQQEAEILRRELDAVETQLRELGKKKAE